MTKSTLKYFPQILIQREQQNRSTVSDDKSTLKYFPQILIQRDKGSRSTLSDEKKYFKVLSIDIDTERAAKSFYSI